MSDTDTLPKVTSGEAEITYSLTLKGVPKHRVKTVVKTHIEHQFGTKHGKIGYVKMVIEPKSHASETFHVMATFTLDEGPALYVEEEKSQYLIGRKKA